MISGVAADLLNPQPLEGVTLRALGSYRLRDLQQPERVYQLATPDLPNLRAALHWALGDAGERVLGQQMAGDLGPIFMQLTLLDEGIDWCTRAIASSDHVELRAEARLHYALSMLYNNRVRYPSSLVAAERALECYRKVDDERATVRALSQAAQQYARAGRFDEARPLADEAIERARAAGDVRLLGAAIRRCAASFPPSQIEEARALFSSAVALLRSLKSADEAAHVLEWWAEAEAAAEFFTRAVDLGIESLANITDPVRMYRTSNVAGYALAANDFECAQPFIAEALELAATARHPLLIAIAVGYSATLRLDDEPHEAARLFGYARARMTALN
ncbi:MAG: soluble NSF attachment family protein [Candidatus Eremiobacteraeota bacterium]|nr:soluble NSF attachment family protein [Candidatus Eremiobacteraeota bacterium]